MTTRISIESQNHELIIEFRCAVRISFISSIHHSALCRVVAGKYCHLSCTNILNAMSPYSTWCKWLHCDGNVEVFKSIVQGNILIDVSI